MNYLLSSLMPAATLPQMGLLQRYAKLQDHYGGKPMTLVTIDGVEIAAMHFVRKAQDGPTVLFCAGGDNSVYESNYEKTIKAYLQRGVNVLCFDYRGVGLSRGTFSEEGSYRDTKVALQYLLSQKVPMKEIAIEGYSSGSGPATQIASESSGAHLLLRCPLAKTSDVGDYKLQQRGYMRPARWIARWIMDYILRYDNLAKIAKVAGTVGLIIAPHDNRVEEPHCQHGERLAQAYLKRSGDKSLIYSEAAQHHESSYKEVKMAAALDSFLQRIGFLTGESILSS